MTSTVITVPEGSVARHSPRPTDCQLRVTGADGSAAVVCATWVVEVVVAGFAFVGGEAGADVAAPSLASWPQAATTRMHARIIARASAAGTAERVIIANFCQAPTKVEGTDTATCLIGFVSRLETHLRQRSRALPGTGDLLTVSSCTAGAVGRGARIAAGS
jgi:hypothetical protein